MQTSAVATFLTEDVKLSTQPELSQAGPSCPVLAGPRALTLSTFAVLESLPVNFLFCDNQEWRTRLAVTIYNVQDVSIDPYLSGCKPIEKNSLRKNLPEASLSFLYRLA